MTPEWPRSRVPDHLWIQYTAVPSDRPTRAPRRIAASTRHPRPPATRRRRPTAGMVVLELYYRGSEELTQLVSRVILPLHARVGLSRVLLTYKGRPSADDNPREAQSLVSQLPAAVAVSAVWSAKNAYVGSGKHARSGHETKEDATFAKFKSYNAALEAAGARSILVVSGAGNKRSLDSVSTLQRAAATAPPTLPLGCVWNPHVGGVLDPYGGAEHREKEFARLQQKLRSGVVHQCWISFGADVDALQLGLARLQAELRAIAAEAGGVTPAIALMGSVFVPSKAWIAKMRFRCWQGTYIGANDDEDGWLSSVESATRISKQVLQLYAEYGVEPVIESAVRTEKEVEQVVQLLATAATGASASAAAAATTAGGAGGGLVAETEDVG